MSWAGGRSQTQDGAASSILRMPAFCWRWSQDWHSDLIGFRASVRLFSRASCVRRLTLPVVHFVILALLSENLWRELVRRQVLAALWTGAERWSTAR